MGKRSIGSDRGVLRDKWLGIQCGIPFAAELKKCMPVPGKRKHKHETRTVLSYLLHGFGLLHDRPLGGRRVRARQESDNSVHDIALREKIDAREWERRGEGGERARPRKRKREREV